MTDAQTLTEVAGSQDWRAAVLLRGAHESDLLELEWEGEFAHFRRMYRDVFDRTLAGRALMWVAELPGVGLLGQVFVQLKSETARRWADGERHAYVHSLRVRPQLRGQGLGAALMDLLEDDLRRRDYRGVTLNVVETNRLARRFYERRGYRVVAADPGRWTYVDQHGATRHVHEPGWRMLKKLD